MPKISIDISRFVGYGQIDPSSAPKRAGEVIAAKLDRDLIRQQDWDYSAVAYGVPAEKREDLRAAIIQEYGEDLELIAPRDPGKPKPKARKRKKKQKKRSSGR